MTIIASTNKGFFVEMSKEEVAAMQGKDPEAYYGEKAGNYNIGYSWPAQTVLARAVQQGKLWENALGGLRVLNNQAQRLNAMLEENPS